MAGKYFEDFTIGDRFKTQRRTITETDIVSFRNLIGMFEDLFLDREYVESQTPFKKLIAPGGLTFSWRTKIFTPCAATRANSRA